ncbi:hypothetical protein PBY51_004528 [Eleginops maclovinus]|uniref:Uncharacterized protein n=1 Tax=Eleginops maclovinus TaxID=56733 RepID=A0AAN8ATG6_ELEMC|nr:hypothetical protein PBY51_004528 [Eleginops maclovinus]
MRDSGSRRQQESLAMTDVVEEGVAIQLFRDDNILHLVTLFVPMEHLESWHQPGPQQPDGPLALNGWS